MTHKLRTATTGRSIHLEAGDEDLRGTLESLRHEVTELHASRRRLVHAADADRERIERDLHEGVQQHLVALAVNLQLARALVDSDPAAATTLFEEMERDVQRALDETAELAQRIYAPLLEAGGLAPTLRSAAVRAGVPASVHVTAGPSYSPEVARTVYLCWLDTLEHESGETRVTITLREEGGAFAFEIAGSAGRSNTGLDRLRDRIEALGGRLSVRSEPGGGTRVSGTLPISRSA